MDHLGVLVEVAFLGESHVAVAALEGALASMGAKMVEVLAHRKDAKNASFVVRSRMLALKKFEKSRLRVGPQEVVHHIVSTLRHVNVLREEAVFLTRAPTSGMMKKRWVEIWVLSILNEDCKAISLSNAILFEKF